MGPFLTVYHHPLGYDSYRFSFFLTGYQCSRSVTGDVNYLEKQHWPIAVSFVTFGISATVVRCFLIFRYWKLSVIFVFTSMSAVQTTLWCLGAKRITSHLYWSSSCSHPCVSPILGLQWVLTLIMQLGSFVGVLVSGLVHMAYVKRDKILLSALCVTVLFHCFSHPLTRFYVLGSRSAQVQLQIFPSLSHFSGNWVRSSRPSKLLRGAFPPIIDDYLHLIIHTHILFSLIRRLMASTIRTGTVTSVVGIIILILFLTDKQSNGELIWQHPRITYPLSLWL